MQRIFPLSFGTPKLEDILINPGAYTLKRTQKSVQMEMAKWYNTDQKTIRKLGPTETGESLASIASELIASRIKDGEITELKVAKGLTSKKFDNLLVGYGKTSWEATERVLGFFQESFHFLINTDEEARRTCRRKEEREECYRLAMGKLAQNMRKPNFQFEKGASILLRKIFRDECVSLRRHLGGKQAGFEGTGINYLDDLPRETASLLYPPVTLLGDDLVKLRKLYPRCFKLFYQTVLMGYSYKELGKTFGKTAKNLKNEAYKCRKKLMQAFKDLTK